MIELLSAQFFPEEHAKCRDFLRHKTTLLAPAILAQNGVFCSTLRQVRAVAGGGWWYGW